jgi:hypothetical protein
MPVSETTIYSRQAAVCTKLEEDIDEHFQHWSCFMTSGILCMGLLKYFSNSYYTCHSFFYTNYENFFFGLPASLRNVSSPSSGFALKMKIGINEVGAFIETHVFYCPAFHALCTFSFLV